MKKEAITEETRDRGAELLAYLASVGVDATPPKPKKEGGWSGGDRKCPICGSGNGLSIKKDGGWQCWDEGCIAPAEFHRGKHHRPCGGDAVDLIRAVEGAKKGQGYKEAGVILTKLGHPGFAGECSPGDWKPSPLTLADFGVEAAPAKTLSLNPQQQARALEVREILAIRADAETLRKEWVVDLKEDPAALPELPEEMRTPAASKHPPKAAFAPPEMVRDWVEKRGYKVIRLKGKVPCQGWREEASSDFEEYSRWWRGGDNIGVHAKMSNRIFIDLDRKNFAEVLAVAEENDALTPADRKALQSVQQLSEEEIAEVVAWQAAAVRRLALDAGGLVHPTPGGGWHIEFLDDGETYPEDESNINPSKREGPLKFDGASWCESRLGTGQVVCYRRDPKLLDKEPKPCPDWLRSILNNPHIQELSPQDLELAALDMDEEDDADDGKEAPAHVRLFAEALERLPDNVEDVIADHTEIIKINGRKEKRVLDSDVAIELMKERRLRFLAGSADARPEDARFREGGMFLWKPEGEWGVASLHQFCDDLLRVLGKKKTSAGTNTMISALLTTLSKAFHTGHRKQVDRPIPLDRRSGDNAIEPMVLDAAGKAISLAKGRCGKPVKQHDDHMLFKQLGVAHDPDAACPEWEKTLRWAMQSKEGTRSPEEVEERVLYLEELLAAPFYQGIYGNTLQAWAFFSGTGGNAKGVCLDVAVHIYGGFADNLKADQVFSTSKHDKGEKIADLAQLEGMWLGVVDEAPSGGEWKTGLIKSATGSLKYTLRKMQKQGAAIPNTWFLITQGNVIPYSPDSSRGWQRRRHILIFDNEQPVDEQDHDLASRLCEKEGPGILNRLLAALERIHARGKLEAPKHIKEEADAFAAGEASLIKRFVDGYLVPSKGKHGKVVDAWEQFKVFAGTEKNAAPEDINMGQDTFRRKLKEALGANRVFKPSSGRQQYWQMLDTEVLPVEEDATPRDIPSLNPAEFEAATAADDPLADETADPTEEEMEAASKIFGILEYREGFALSLPVVYARCRAVLGGMSLWKLRICLERMEGITLDTSGKIPHLRDWCFRREGF